MGKYAAPLLVVVLCNARLEVEQLTRKASEIRVYRSFGRSCINDTMQLLTSSDDILF